MSDSNNSTKGDIVSRIIRRIAALVAALALSLAIVAPAAAISPAGCTSYQCLQIATLDSQLVAMPPYLSAFLVGSWGYSGSVATFVNLPYQVQIGYIFGP